MKRGAARYSGLGKCLETGPRHRREQPSSKNIRQGHPFILKKIELYAVYLNTDCVGVRGTREK
jgi:hypothetical protein